MGNMGRASDTGAATGLGVLGEAARSPPAEKEAEKTNGGSGTSAVAAISRRDWTLTAGTGETDGSCQIFRRDHTPNDCRPTRPAASQRPLHPEDHLRATRSQSVSEEL